MDQKTQDLIEELATVLEKLGWKMSPPAMESSGVDDVNVVGAVIGKEDFVKETMYALQQFYTSHSENTPDTQNMDDLDELEQKTDLDDPKLYKKNGRLLN